MGAVAAGFFVVGAWVKHSQFQLFGAEAVIFSGGFEITGAFAVVGFP